MKGGRPRKRKNRTVISETGESQYKDKDKEKEEEKDNEKDGRASARKGAREPAPTLDEVLDFCRSEKLRVDGNTFWNYYQANGWQAGNHPVRDWRAKLREWSLRDGSGDAPRARPATEPANPALNYAQREYRDEDFGEGFYFDVVAEYGEAKA